MSPLSATLPKARLETLVDGIFAIAMTILVLEVKVPELAQRRDGAELLHALGRLAPTLGAYFFSFGMLGLFWHWHHRLAAKLSRVDLPLLAVSFAFLALVSFFPFVAALLGRYPANPVALGVYLPCIGLILGSQVAFFALARRRGLLLPDLPPEEVRAAHQRNIQSLAIFSFACLPSALRFGPLWVALALASGALCLLWKRRAGRVPA